MRGFEAKNNVSDSVENWTIQQCEEHLKQYPKGFKADKARARLKKLQQPVPVKKEEAKPSSNGGKLPSTSATNRTQVDQTTLSSNNGKYKQLEDTIVTIFKVLATILCVAIMIAGIDMIFTRHPGYAAVLPFFYFPIRWLLKMWD